MTNKTWNAQSYSENSQLQFRASEVFFSTLSLKGSETILDIGCGTGLLASETAKKVPNGKVIGIDSSENMINYASQNFISPNLEFKLMRAEGFNFSHNFDVIVSSFCLHWIQDKQALFYRIVKHLNPGGITRLIMPFKHEEIAKIRHTIMSEAKWSSYFDANSISEILIFDNQYDVYASKAGFCNLKFETEQVTTQFESSAKLKTFLLNVTSCLDQLPTKQLQDEFIQDVVDAYLELYPLRDDGSCFITYTYGKVSSQGVKLYS